jgi:transcriptional regulator NrdR family protein
MPLRCPFCGSLDLRNAHIRRVDYPRLLLLQRPVRCRNCRERFFAFMLRMIGMKSTADPGKT